MPDTITERSPQQRLAEALGGTILGPSSIQVGTRLVVASVTGLIRVDGVAIGTRHDSTETLARNFYAAVGAS